MNQSTLNIIVNGAHGKMGTQTVKTIQQTAGFKLIAALGRHDNLQQTLQQNPGAVVVDFTRPECAFDHTKLIIEHGAHPVIGTTGFTPEQIDYCQQLSKEKECGGIIAPNFSIGAILTMRFSAMAANYLHQAEIIEMHHQEKKDAPSGTAIKTAEMIAKSYEKNNVVQTTQPCHETIAHARGATHQAIPIHSLRLPGFVAHQQVIFGGTGETLTIRHDTIHRECFMPGVIFACRKVVELKELVYGLDPLL